MIPFRRPPEPEDFQSRTAGARGEIDAAVAVGATPVFPPLWKHHKELFARAQHGKCCYCETYIRGSQWGEVEHFAPKAQVTDDDGGVWRPGYYFRAYDWSNYLFACSVCNNAKANHFPLAEPRKESPRPDRAEKALLINPYDEPHPWRHFTFDDLGTIDAMPGNAQAVATIATCDLNREALSDPRRERLNLVTRFLDSVLSALESPRPTREQCMAIQTILDAGTEDRPHAGAVRGLVELGLDVHWDIFEKHLRSTLSLAQPAGTGGTVGTT